MNRYLPSVHRGISPVIRESVSRPVFHQGLSFQLLGSLNKRVKRVVILSEVPLQWDGAEGSAVAFLTDSWKHALGKK